jgi:hypothetical protein
LIFFNKKVNLSKLNIIAMKKIIVLISIIIVFIVFCQNSYSQGFTPPKVILGFTLDGNFATNDAHSTNFWVDPNFYGMIWGRGITLNSKFGMGVRKNHRITLSATYNKMVNKENTGIPFLVFKPSDGRRYTDYNFWSGAIGYEYAFNPRCKSKQYIGFGINGNYITTPPEAFFNFDNAFRMGAQLTTGYEFVLDKNFKYGLVVGLKYSLTNILGTQNGTGTLNDGSGEGGPTYWRRIGILSINFGMNFYTGVEPYRGIK